MTGPDTLFSIKVHPIFHTTIGFSEHFPFLGFLENAGHGVLGVYLVARVYDVAVFIYEK